METTDLRTLREEFITRIRQLTPSSERQVEERRLQRLFRPVRRVENVPSGGVLRCFYIGFDAESYRAVPDGIFGDGVEMEVALEIWVNYGGLQDDEDSDMLIMEDGIELYFLLDRIRDPIVTGFVGPQATDWPAWQYADEGDNPGAVWGKFTFLIRYLARDS